LEDVSTGSPHVASHNEERDAINEILSTLDGALGLKTIDGDVWLLANATYDGSEFHRIDTTKAAFGWQLQGANEIPGEAELGFNISGAILWVASVQSYTLIRGGGDAAGDRYAAVGGWELGHLVSSERQFTIGGSGMEIDGYGTFPYSRVVSGTSGTVFHRKIAGFVRNVFPNLDGYDDQTQDSWVFGYVEDQNIENSGHWSVARIPANTGVTDVFDELLQMDAHGHMTITAEGSPTVAPSAVVYSSSVTGDDGAGVVTFGTGSAPGTDAQFTVTFANPWLVAPKTISLTPYSASAVACGLYISAMSDTSFTVSAANVPAASTTFQVGYRVIG